jgi:hypothetical protein
VPAKASGRKGVGWHPSGKFQVARLFLTSQKILRRGSQNVTSQKNLRRESQNVPSTASRLSAFGPKRTSQAAQHMSAFGDKADMTLIGHLCRF